MALVLRDYQAAMEEDLRAAYRRGARAPLLVAPTGSGKTALFCSIASQAAARGRRTLILVHRRELLDQTSRTLDAYGVAHGLVAAGVSWRGDELVQVASVQTIVHRLRRLTLPGGAPWLPDLVVVDEAHHATAGSSWGTVLAWYGLLGEGMPGSGWTGARALGVTATPERLDGRGLGVDAGGPFDALVLGPSVASLVARGYLSPPVCYAPAELQLDASAVHSRGGDYVASELSALLDERHVWGDAVAQYRRHCEGQPAIAFLPRVGDAERLAEGFRAAGIAAASIDGGLKDSERRARIRDLGAGALRVLCSCEIVSEGTDIPVVAAALLLRPTQSLRLYLQQVGRALRPYPGKRAAIILDHVGNVARHGLPDEDRAWSLDATARGKRADEGEDAAASRVPRRLTCEGCGAVVRPAPRCPACGRGFTLPLTLEFRAGELVEVDPDALKARRAARLRRARVGSLAEAQRLGAELGYRPGWAQHYWAGREARRARGGEG